MFGAICRILEWINDFFFSRSFFYDIRAFLYVIFYVISILAKHTCENPIKVLWVNISDM